TLLVAIVARALPEPRPPDAGRAMPPDDLAIGVLAENFVDEQILHRHDVALGAEHLGDMRDATRAVAQTRRLYDDVDRRNDHVADRLRGQRKAAHRDHGFETAERLARRVGVQRAHRTV